MNKRSKLSVDYRPVQLLKPSVRNARTHSKEQIAQIAASVSEFGFTNPILIDENGEIIVGHGRLGAAIKIGMTEVPVIVIGGLTPERRRALMLADNKIALNAGWDLDLLQAELSELAIADLDFDIDVTGFGMPEIDQLLSQGSGTTDPADPADEPVEIGGERVVSRLGDLWVLGKHQLACGNALEPESYLKLLGDELADMVISDPPYNVEVQGHVSGRGRHKEFVMASGEMSTAEFRTFLRTALMCTAAAVVDGAVMFVFMDWRHIVDLALAAEPILGDLLNLCVWNKTNAGMGSLYRSKHELVAVFKKGSAPHVNNVELGKNGRYRTNVWDYAGANTFRHGRDQDLDDHPTVKPVAMIADAMLDCSRRGDIVLDPFAGSGTILLAAERTGRVARAIELDPRYVDVALRRWQNLTGKAVRLAETDEDFNAVSARREIEAESPKVSPRGRRPRGGRS